MGLLKSDAYDGDIQISEDNAVTFPSKNKVIISLIRIEHSIDWKLLGFEPVAKQNKHIVEYLIIFIPLMLNFLKALINQVQNVNL